MGKKLDLGCGPVPFRKRESNPFWKDSITLDISSKHKPDIVADASERIPLSDGSISDVLCVEVIEHIPPDRLKSFIKEILRILEKGGKLHLQCPDFRACSYTYLNTTDLKEKEYAKVSILGMQKNEFDIHKNIFTEEELTKELTSAGFSSVIPNKVKLKISLTAIK